MARLLPLERFADCAIPGDDPLRFHYHPIVGRFYRRRIDGCLALLGTGERVLDVGYGSGTSFLGLAERFREVHGLDTHDYGPAIARVFAGDGVHVDLRRGSILDAPYPDAMFDAVLAMSVLEHLQPAEQPRVMREMSRLLRPGGALVVGVPASNAMMTLAFGLLGCDIRRHHFSSPAVVMAAAEDAGLHLDRVARHPAFAPASLGLYVWFRARTPAATAQQPN